MSGRLRTRMTLRRRKRRERRRIAALRVPTRLIRPYRDLFKKNLKVPMRYVESVAINPGSGTVASHVFSCNGCFDPNITGVGHQPLYFDQMVGVFYNHYTVTQARIKVTYMSPNTTLYTGVSNVGVLITAGTSAPTAWNDMLEQAKKNMSFRTLGNAAGGHDVKIVKKKVNIAKWLGIQDILDEDDNAGTSSANPAEQIYFQVFAVGASDTSDSATIECVVEIDYDVILHEPKFITGS